MTPVFPLMLARTYEARRIRDWRYVSVEPKLDGVRVAVKVNSGGVQVFSRTGRLLTMFDHLHDPLEHMFRRMRIKHGTPVMVDGEMRSGTTFEQIGGAIHRKDHTEEEAVLHVFFAMPWGRFRAGLDTVTQHVRLEQMEAWVDWHHGRDGVKLVTSTFIENIEHITSATDCFIAEGYEGSMVKQTDVPYGGRRSWDWMKVKQEQTADVRVVSMKAGKGKFADTLGALIVKYKGHQVDVSGMTDAQRDAWWRAPALIVGKMIEVKFQYVTENGSLRHPRFKRLRPDKD